MSPPKPPRAEAARVSKVLKTVLGDQRFPLDVATVALELSRQWYPNAPIDKVTGKDFDGIEGALVKHPEKTRWKIVYNDNVMSEGRKRFTIAHEFGHYLLHRDLSDLFECGTDDIASGIGDRSIEQEADLFATNLLMPLDDFREQIKGEDISLDLLRHCADRYGVSLTAATLQLLEIVPKRAVLIVSNDDHMRWAKSNNAAYKSRAVFATRKSVIELPEASLAHSSNAAWGGGEQAFRVADWFPHEPAKMQGREMTVISDQYDYALTLLLFPDAEFTGAFHDEGESLQDTFDHFVQNGQNPY